MSDVSCIVSLDGQRIADTAATIESVPTVLDSLTVNWGRATQLEQPDPATCVFKLALRPDDTATPALLTKGRRVTVTSEATLWPDEFGTLNLAPTWQNVYLSDTSSGWITGSGPDWITVEGSKPLGSIGVHIPPGPIQPSQTNPAAWDEIPRAAAGQVWEFDATIELPDTGARTRAEIRPVVYSDPWKSAGRVYETLTPTVTGSTYRATWKVPAKYSGCWIGFQIFITYPVSGWYHLNATDWQQLGAETWQGLATTRLSTPRLIAPADGMLLTATVFDGGISSARTVWDDGLNAPVSTITATDALADLGGTPIGDDPWPQQPAAVRLARIIDLAAPGAQLVIDPTVSAPVLAAQDVDSQNALDLAQTVAVSTGGVLWATSHAVTGPYFRLEDPAQRPATNTLTDTGSGLEIITDTGIGVELSARHLLRDGAEIIRDPSTTAATSIVRWKDQTDPENEAERTAAETDPNRLAIVGPSTISTGTDLTTQLAALALAQRLLMRTPAEGWRLPGVTWDWNISAGATPSVATMIALLDATRRMGALVRLTDLPEWLQLGAAAYAYLDGGTYQYAGARWTLALNLTSANGEAAAITWEDLAPAWRWQDFNAITWQQLTTAHT